MKKILAYLLLLALLYLSVGGLFFSCRSLLKTVQKQDSTASSQERTENRYDREVITEYVPYYDTLWQIRYDTLWRTHVQTLQVPWPYAVPGPERIIKQTIRESGETVATKQTDTAVQSDSREKDLQTPILNQITMLLWALIALIIAALLLFFIFGRKRP